MWSNATWTSAALETVSAWTDIHLKLIFTISWIISADNEMRRVWVWIWMGQYEITRARRIELLPPPSFILSPSQQQQSLSLSPGFTIFRPLCARLCVFTHRLCSESPDCPVLSLCAAHPPCYKYIIYNLDCLKYFVEYYFKLISVIFLHLFFLHCYFTHSEQTDDFLSVSVG